MFIYLTDASTTDVKQYKSFKHFSLWYVAGTNFAGSDVSTDWDMNESKFSVCQQGELMGSPWFSHVRQTEKHIFSSSGSPVLGLFFLEASNPGGSLHWRHRALPPPHCLLMCCTHTLISSAAHERQSLLWSLWLLTSKHLIKADCLIWPAWGGYTLEKGGAEWICGLVWVWGSQSSSLSSSHSLFSTSPFVSLLFGCMSCIMWPGSVAPLHFPSWQKGNIVAEGAGAGLCYVAG